MAEEKGIAMAILGLVAVIAVVGLVLLFKGGAGKVTYGPGPFIVDTPERLCSNMDCENGMGAVVIGERGDYWICGCPEHFTERTVAQWSNSYRGDEGHNGLEFPNPDNNAWLVRKFRER